MKPLSYKQQLEVIEEAYELHKTGNVRFGGMCYPISSVIYSRFSTSRVYCKSSVVISDYIPIFTYENLKKLGEQGYIPKLNIFSSNYPYNRYWWSIQILKGLHPNPEREEVYLFLIDYLNKRTTLWKRIKLWYKRLL